MYMARNRAILTRFQSRLLIFVRLVPVPASVPHIILTTIFKSKVSFTQVFIETVWKQAVLT